MKINKVEELEIWKTSTQIAIEVYGITNGKEFQRDFGLKDQIRRAIVSVSSNIAEGFERNNNKEFKRYLKIAKGSLGETKTQLFIAYKINYLLEDEYKKLNDRLIELSYKMGSLINYLNKLILTTNT